MKHRVKRETDISVIKTDTQLDIRSDIRLLAAKYQIPAQVQQ